MLCSIVEGKGAKMKELWWKFTPVISILAFIYGEEKFWETGSFKAVDIGEAGIAVFLIWAVVGIWFLIRRHGFKII